MPGKISEELTELEAAIERLLGDFELFAAACAKDGENDKRVAYQVCADELRTLVDARKLREGERALPVTEEWLRSIGFTEQDGWNGIWLGSLRWIRHHSDVTHFTFGQQTIIWDASVTTRGQVLGLLAALALK